MKKTILTVALALTVMGGSVLSTSCIGSFKLTNKLLTWNSKIDSKFVNELVFIAFWILPVYEVSALADILVINSIEFWSGSNPVAQGTKVIEGENGRYLCKCDKNGYTITGPDGVVTRLDFNADTREWSTIMDGQRVVFMTFIDDTHVKMPTTDGRYMTVETSADGVFAYRQAAAATNFALAR